MKNCEKCGAEVADEVLVCDACGTKVVSEAEEVLPECEVPAEETEEAEAAEESAEEETEEAEAAEESAEEETEEAEAAEESAEEETEEAEAAEESAEEAEKPKKKNGWTFVSTIVVIVSGLIVLGLIGFMGYKEGWFDALKPKAKSVCEMGDYTKIEVISTAVEISDQEVDLFVKSILLGDSQSDETVTDEMCEAYSSSTLRETYKTVDEFREYARGYIYDYFLHGQMLEYLKSITTVKSYDADQEEMLKAYSLESLEEYAASNGTTAGYLASYYGYESPEALALEEAHSNMDEVIIFDYIIAKEKLDFTEERLNEDLEDYMKSYGYDQTQTIEEFKESQGKTWCFIFENLQSKYNFVMEALEQYVVIVEEPEE